MQDVVYVRLGGQPWILEKEVKAGSERSVRIIGQTSRNICVKTGEKKPQTKKEENEYWAWEEGRFDRVMDMTMAKSGS